MTFSVRTEVDPEDYVLAFVHALLLFPQVEKKGPTTAPGVAILGGTRPAKFLLTTDENMVGLSMENLTGTKGKKMRWDAEEGSIRRVDSGCGTI